MSTQHLSHGISMLHDMIAEVGPCTSTPLDGATMDIMQTIRQMFSPGCVLLNLRQRVFHVKHLKSTLAPVCQVVPSASHATRFTNRPTCIFIAITPTGCWVAARFAAQLQHLVHLGLGPPRNAVCGLLVQGLVELGEFSGACLQELPSRRQARLCKARLCKGNSNFRAANLTVTF